MIQHKSKETTAFSLSLIGTVITTTFFALTCFTNNEWALVWALLGSIIGALSIQMDEAMKSFVNLKSQVNHGQFIGFIAGVIMIFLMTPEDFQYIGTGISGVSRLVMPFLTLILRLWE